MKKRLMVKFMGLSSLSAPMMMFGVGCILSDNQFRDAVGAPFAQAITDVIAFGLTMVLVNAGLLPPA